MMRLNWPKRSTTPSWRASILVHELNAAQIRIDRHDDQRDAAETAAAARPPAATAAAAENPAETVFQAAQPGVHIVLARLLPGIALAAAGFVPRHCIYSEFAYRTRATTSRRTGLEDRQPNAKGVADEL